jgi:hypothetical protein
MLQSVAEQQSKSDFPNGVPSPRSRPAAANNPNPNAAKLPQRGGEEPADAYDRATESIEKHTAKLKADTEAVGQGAAATEQLRAQYQLLAAAKQAGIPVDDKVRKNIQDLAKDAGAAAEALAKARVANDISRGQQTAFLTPQELAIANQLKGIYPDVATALQSAEAASLRFNATIKDLASLGQDINRGFLVEFTQQIRNGASAMDALKTAGLNALGKIADKLASMAADQLWTSAFGGSSGLGGFFGSLFGGGSSVGPAGSITVGTQSFPKFASGTDFAPGGLSIVGENGPELLNIPRGSQVIPNDALKSGIGGSNVTVGGATVIIQGDASEKTVALIKAALAQHDAAMPSKVVAAVRDAKPRRLLG